jgi:amylosucrase
MSPDARRTLDRLLPRLGENLPEAELQSFQLFAQRLEHHFERLFRLLLGLYGNQFDFFYHLERILKTALNGWSARPKELRSLDRIREESPSWFTSEQMLGAVCYVDLYAKDLAGMQDRIPYLKQLGVTYLHLMPFFACPEGENDGGYAVSSYRAVQPNLGTIADLRTLTDKLHGAEISLVVDFVFNHTSDEHEWAVRALQGDPAYEDYYFLFPDRTMPDRFEKNLREIFPQVRRGNFTYREDVQKWVWTTFNSYQWDLNYHNPEVFRSMCEEMIFLANCGVDVLRLDALAFTWKEEGTTCENLPQAHTLIQAFNAVSALACPSLMFKSEAIVHPDEVEQYISKDECALSYNPLLMALLWEGLATREIDLLRYSMQKRFEIPNSCSWVNYVRCHDDIGWTFSDEDAAAMGKNGFDHRMFLNDFYTGVFPGSFARGMPFQYNPETRDCRISGTCASLSGLEKALAEETEVEVELAVRRIILVHSIILAVGGIPLIYLGDELATLNDYSFTKDPVKAHDSRWVHRPKYDPERDRLRAEPHSPVGRVFTRLEQMIRIRKGHPVFAASVPTQFPDTRNPHVLGFVREHAASRLFVLANFGEQKINFPGSILRAEGEGISFTDLITNSPHSAVEPLVLEPYQTVWLMRRGTI